MATTRSRSASRSATRESGERASAARAIPGVSEEITARGDYLSRDEVLKHLHIKPQTLYSYVSRGFIRSVPQPDGRSSFYLREDVEKVRSRSVARAGHGPAAASAMRWGEPVIVTRLTELTDAGPRYRSRLAVELARTRVPFENVAEYLWTGELAEDTLVWQQTPDPAGLGRLLASAAKLHSHAHILQLMSMTVHGLGIAEGNRRERIRLGSTPTTAGRRLIRAFAATLGFLSPKQAYSPLEDGEPVAAGLARMFGISNDALHLNALNAALVAVADHELNPATFAARVAASGSADMHSCIGAALDTHYGTLVGRTCDRAEELFEPPADPEIVFERAMAMRAASRSLPGFNHPHYLNGDPRGRLMMELAMLVGRSRRVVGNMMMTLRRLEEECEARPTVECALVLLCRALGMPDRSAAGLYALGRTAGWVAHVIEQRLAGFMIRPRAQFDHAAD